MRSLSFRERYLSLRSFKVKPADFQRVSYFSPLEIPHFHKVRIQIVPFLFRSQSGELALLSLN